MSKVFARFMNDESGATAIEYALIGCLISVAIIVGATSVGGSLNTAYGKIGTKVNAEAAKIN